MPERSFVVETSSVNVKGLRCKADTPASAAKRLADKLYENRTVKKITFCVRECTKGSKKKQYGYVAVKKKLTKPYVINGKVRHFKVDVKKNKMYRGGEKITEIAYVSEIRDYLSVESSEQKNFYLDANMYNNIKMILSNDYNYKVNNVNETLEAVVNENNKVIAHIEQMHNQQTNEDLYILRLYPTKTFSNITPYQNLI